MVILHLLIQSRETRNWDLRLDVGIVLSIYKIAYQGHLGFPTMGRTCCAANLCAQVTWRCITVLSFLCVQPEQLSEGRLHLRHRRRPAGLSGEHNGSGAHSSWKQCVYQTVYTVLGIIRPL
jgi:hypothetical protein